MPTMLIVAHNVCGKELHIDNVTAVPLIKSRVAFYLTNNALMSESSSSGTSNLLVRVNEISVFDERVGSSPSTGAVSPITTTTSSQTVA